MTDTTAPEEEESWISKALQQDPPPDPLTPGWILRHSRSMPGTYYYYHQETGYSQWDPPVEQTKEDEVMAPEQAVVDEKENLIDEKEETKKRAEEPIAAVEQPPPKRSKPTNDQPKEVRVLHLLKKHKGSRRPASWRNPKITSTKEESTAELEELASILKESQTPEEMRATFEELARTESDCSSAKRGGDLGFFGKKKMQPAFEKAAFDLEIGQLSDIVETSSGVHVLLRIG